MRIPLPKLMRNLRVKQTEASMTPLKQRFFLSLWSYLAARPAMYRPRYGACHRHDAGAGPGRPVLRHLPLMKGWTDSRDLIVPEAGGTFFARYRKRQRVMAMNDRSIILDGCNQPMKAAAARRIRARQHRLLPAT